MGRGNFYLVFLRFVEIQIQPFHTLKGSRSLLPSLFKVCGNPDAIQPYHTLKGSRSLLPCLLKVCGNPDATLLHFEGVKVTFTKSF